MALHKLRVLNHTVYLLTRWESTNCVLLGQVSMPGQQLRLQRLIMNDVQ